MKPWSRALRPDKSCDYGTYSTYNFVLKKGKESSFNAFFWGTFGETWNEHKLQSAFSVKYIENYW